MVHSLLGLTTLRAGERQRLGVQASGQHGQPQACVACPWPEGGQRGRGHPAMFSESFCVAGCRRFLPSGGEEAGPAIAQSQRGDPGDGV